MNIVSQLTTNPNDIPWGDFPLDTYLICIGVAIVLGIIISTAYSFGHKKTTSMRMGIALIPALVTGIVLVIGDNIVAGVAVLGAFALVRFRSAPGSARDLCAIFMVMAVGLMCGLQILKFAIIFSLIMIALFIIYDKYINSKLDEQKLLIITVPEDLNYTASFDEVLAKHTKSYTLVEVKTVNMGSLYRLTYEIVINNFEAEKNLIDEARTRNGNLEISIIKSSESSNQL